MPTYTYICPSCGDKVEITCSVEEMETTEFTHYSFYHKEGDIKCTGKLRKLVDAPGAILQGDGWPGKEIKGGD